MLGKGAGGCRASRSLGLGAPVSDQLSQDNMQCVQGISSDLYTVMSCMIAVSTVVL